MQTDSFASSNYKTVAVINDEHGIYLVQDTTTEHFFVQKILDIYNPDIYRHLQEHPITGIPRIISIEEAQDQLIIIEEFISGTPLNEVVLSGSLTKDTVLSYVLGLCRIVNELHSADPPIIHRDIKPSNIIVTGYDNIYLLDYNAAKYYSKEAAADTMLLGTHGYAAPEQYGFGSSSPKTDIYAIGILLRDLVASMSEPTTDFDAIIKRCTQMEPEERYPTVAALSKALMELSSAHNPHEEADASDKFLPPGFRTLTPWKMVIASVAYLFIGYVCLSMNLPDMPMARLWLERIFLLIMVLSVIAGTSNYLGIQRILPFTKNNRRFVRIIGIILLDIFLVLALLVIMVIIENIAFS